MKDRGKVCFPRNSAGYLRAGVRTDFLPAGSTN